MISKLLGSKDFKSAVIASIGLGLGYIATAMASGEVLDWKAVSVAAGSVAANAFYVRLRPFFGGASD